MENRVAGGGGNRRAGVRVGVGGGTNCREHGAMGSGYKQGRGVGSKGCKRVGGEAYVR